MALALMPILCSSEPVLTPLRAPTVPSAATANFDFPNRRGIDTQVYRGSAELASICALMGKIPTAEYMEGVKAVNAKAADVYRYIRLPRSGMWLHDQ
ncbi:MAG: hypothetical protein KA806_08755 [Sulfuritalea sp.]|nr:hypothetical protein [Sulfuritalea sp.]